jgi:ribosomal protein S11
VHRIWDHFAEVESNGILFTSRFFSSIGKRELGSGKGNVEGGRMRGRKRGDFSRLIPMGKGRFSSNPWRVGVEEKPFSRRIGVGAPSLARRDPVGIKRAPYPSHIQGLRSASDKLGLPLRGSVGKGLKNVTSLFSKGRGGIRLPNPSVSHLRIDKLRSFGRGDNRKGDNRRGDNSRKLLKRRKLGVVSITATGNNTLFTLSDGKGKLIASVSAGSVGFRNSGKSTIAGAEKGAARIINKGKEYGFNLLRIEMKGIGYTKVRALRAMIYMGIPIVEIVEKTNRSHNGCRLPRKRRL